MSNAELTVDELEEAVAAATGPWATERVLPAWYEMWPRWRQAVHKAAQRGVLCFGPNRGRRVTYTNPHRWLPAFKPIAADTALAELVRRFLHAYGPAAPHHFAQWLAAPRGWAIALFESLADRLRLVELEGVSAYVSAGDDEPPATQPAGVRLLPYFDAFVVGCHPRAHLFPGRAAERALSGGQAGNFPVILVDGIVGGVWHQRRAGRTLDVTVELFDRLAARQRRELELQVQRVGEILEAKPRWTIGKVAVGGHA